MMSRIALTSHYKVEERDMEVILKYGNIGRNSQNPAKAPGENQGKEWKPGLPDRTVVHQTRQNGLYDDQFFKIFIIYFVHKAASLWYNQTDNSVRSGMWLMSSLKNGLVSMLYTVYIVR